MPAPKPSKVGHYDGCNDSDIVQEKQYSFSYTKGTTASWSKTNSFTFELSATIEAGFQGLLQLLAPPLGQFLLQPQLQRKFQLLKQIPRLPLGRFHQEVDLEELKLNGVVKSTFH